MTTMASGRAAARPGTLLVVGSGSAMPHHRDRRADHEGRERLLRSLPAAARVLGWQDAHETSGALREAYRNAHPRCEWQSFDGVHALHATTGPFDLIVLDQGLIPFSDPAEALRLMRQRAGPETVLAMLQPQDTSLAMLQRWVEADLTDSDDGPLARQDWRLRSLASATKLMMDAGWMPTLMDACHEAPRQDAFAQQALALAAAAGVPAATAWRQWRMRSGVVHACAPFETPACTAGARASLAVVVPTTRDAQLRVNVERSPGLHELNARVISVRGATDPADALARAAAQVKEDWVLLCHQDVYFARGFGTRLAALLAGIDAIQRRRTLIGFAGIGVNPKTHAYEHAGFVIDRTQRFDNPASEHAVSIDELALVLPRESLLSIDPALGWHLWATDLCLQAICTHKFFPRIVRAPLFHNSHSDHQLPAAFHESAVRLRAKYPDFGPIHTLCGVIGSGTAPQGPTT